MRVLGIDFGERRVGLAVSDPSGLIASSCGILERNSDQQVAEQIACVATQMGVELVVVGLPLNADGAEGYQARRVRRFGELLRRQIHIPLIYWDEYNTTTDAGALLRLRGASRRRRRVDDVAAAVLLQSYLDAQRGI